MEKVTRFSGWLAWDEIGRIVAYDEDILAMCGYGKAQSLSLKPVASVLESGDFTLGT